MTTLVQTFLQTHTFEELVEAHGIKIRFSDDRHKVSINYNQILAHDSDKLAQQCRGLILRRADLTPFVPDAKPIGDTIVVARPFDRFFNVGQDAAVKIDFEALDTRFYEKLDGTLCIVYFDDLQKKWHVATRAVCEANLGIAGYEDLTFRALFEKALGAEAFGEGYFNDWANMNLGEHVTFMFELCTPMNTVVVMHEDYKIHLLGARVTKTGQEIDSSIYSIQGVKHAPTFSLGSLEEMVDFVSSRDPSSYEGLVACDKDFRRVKVKSAGYMALNRVKDSALKSPRGLMQLILMEKLDDVIPLLPEYALERAYKLQEGFRKMNTDFMVSYKEILNTADLESPIFNPNSPSLIKQHRKSFAIAVQNHPCGWMGPMIGMYQKRYTCLMDYVKDKQNVDGSWPNGFLDSVMKEIDV